MGKRRKTYHAASVEISLEPRAGPGRDGFVEGVLEGLGSGVGGFGVGGLDIGGGGAEGRFGRVSDGVAEDFGAVFAD
jgi:hypothetical protein